MLALCIIMSILAYFGVGLVVGTTAKIRSKEKAIQVEYRQIDARRFNSERMRVTKAIENAERMDKGNSSIALVLGTVFWPLCLIAFCTIDLSKFLEVKLSYKILPEDSLTNRLARFESEEKLKEKNAELVKLAKKAGLETKYLEM